MSSRPSSPPAPLIEDLRREHHAILAALEQPSTSAEAVLALTRELRPTVLRHLDTKDRLYALVGAACQQSGDAAGAQLLSIFATNARTMSQGIRSFFESAATASPDASQTQRFQTVQHVLKNLLSTEDRAVLPIFQRYPDVLPQARP